jgi:peptide/nickel transport system substrate-binding protein
MERLREKYALATDAAERKAVALEVQHHYMKIVTHVHLGEAFGVAGLGAKVEGWINAPVTVFWGVSKK